MKLHDYLANAQYDFNKEMVERIQQVHSPEIEQLQRADASIGALSYLHRSLQTSAAKQALIERIRPSPALAKTAARFLPKRNSMSLSGRRRPWNEPAGAVPFPW